MTSGFVLNRWSGHDSAISLVCFRYMRNGTEQQLKSNEYFSQMSQMSQGIQLPVSENLFSLALGSLI